MASILLSGLPRASPAFYNTSSAHHPMSRPCLGDGGALRPGAPSQLGAIGSGQAVAYGVDSGCRSNLPKSWVEAHGLQGVWGEGTHLSLS